MVSTPPAETPGRATPDRGTLARFLDGVEWLGNRLPEPAILFVFGAALVMVLSQVVASAGWSVQPKTLRPILQPADVSTPEAPTSPTPALDEHGKPRFEIVDDLTRNNGKPFTARSLLTGDGLYWAISSMVDNFMRFPPLGVVLVAMLGIGLAEHTGLIPAALRAVMLVVPRFLLTPAVIFVGVLSSITTDAGFVVLPPIAAALYAAAGRSPLAGIAAVFAGCGAGFSANLLITPLDALLAGFTGLAAKTIDPGYNVSPTCNWYFLATSGVLITLLAWGISVWLVEPRLSSRAADQGGPQPASNAAADAPHSSPIERRALCFALLTAVLAAAALALLTLIPGAPLHPEQPKLPDALRGPGLGDQHGRWIESIVPMIAIFFFLPGLAYGLVVRTIHPGRRARDIVAMLTRTMVSMAPVMVLAFFAAQFIAYFNFSNLDKMLAYRGGELLFHADLPREVLIVAFILLVVLFDLLIVSASAKYAIFAPVFVPMLMLAGLQPELTQAAYRIGDSVANIISPLNPYWVIILATAARWAPREGSAGLGTLLSLMIPYSIVLGIAWTSLLLVWQWLGIPLGIS